MYDNIKFINIVVLTKDNKIANAGTFTFTESEPRKMDREIHDLIDELRKSTPFAKILIQVNGVGEFKQYYYHFFSREVY